MKKVVVRTLSSLIYGPIMLVCAWFGSYPLQILISLITILGIREFSLLAQDNKDVKLHLPALIICGLILTWSIFFFEFTYVIPLFILFLFLFLSWDVFANKEQRAVEKTSFSMFSLIYIPLLLSFLCLVRMLEHGKFLLIILYGCIWLTDSAAYFLGVKFGKHKNIFRASKNKSIEGFVAGFITAFVGAYLLNHLVHLIFGYFVLGSWKDIIAFGFIVAFFGQLGDLIESNLKRDFDVKDSSNLIPGHGGILDRFDSLLISAPFLYFYFILIG
ncbi:MAG TPA: phosphatidate cytidylyltransferase [Candidatus Cloacimonetes bacterium]|nr:phosphatidate cytidylyltransferase [Candidatus Cloacimonadota bacterium]